MMCMNILSEMQLEMRTVLEDNILSFWEDKMTDSVHGGFYGRITGTGKLEPQAVKGAVPPVGESRISGDSHSCQTCHY